MLYICPTPIGNLEDITIRVLNTLKEVDYIACEDTRQTLKLLNHYDIKSKLVSIHEHNEFIKKDFIINDLKEGLNIALVSDAGLPGIQDPGKIIIEAVIENNLEFTVLPGPCAFVTAVVGSGIVDKAFTFLGFLPRKSKERKAILESYGKYEGELVMYESPHRIKELVEDISETLGDRKLVLAREISKKFEEYLRMDAFDMLEALKSRQLKGEIVLIIEKGKPQVPKELLDVEILNLVETLLQEGISKKDAIKMVSKENKIPKNKVYEIATKIK